MRSFNQDKIFNNLMVPEIINLLTAIHEQKGKQELFIEAKPDILDAMLEVAKIQSTGASNRIEGIYTSNNRLDELVKEKQEPLNRSEQEIVGYRDVLKTIHENYEHIDPTANTILQLHRDLYAFNPSSAGGKWKMSDNRIEEIDTDGQRRVRFQPMSAFETPTAMAALCESFMRSVNQGKYDMLLLIPVFIFDFLCIHPFSDGNGRMSRLLTLMLLYRAGYIVGKYISVEKVIEETKETYYEVLQESSEKWDSGNNDYTSFVKYYLEIILKAYREFASRVEYVQKRKLTKFARVKYIFDDNVGKLSKSDIVTLCPDISISMIQKAIAKLYKDGYILKIGAGKTTAYIRNRED
jgi:Fic family protein